MRPASLLRSAPSSTRYLRASPCERPALDSTGAVGSVASDRPASTTSTSAITMKANRMSRPPTRLAYEHTTQGGALRLGHDLRQLLQNDRPTSGWLAELVPVGRRARFACSWAWV